MKNNSIDLRGFLVTLQKGAVKNDVQVMTLKTSNKRKLYRKVVRYMKRKK